MTYGMFEGSIDVSLTIDDAQAVIKLLATRPDIQAQFKEVLALSSTAPQALSSNSALFNQYGS